MFNNYNERDNWVMVGTGMVNMSKTLRFYLSKKTLCFDSENGHRYSIEYDDEKDAQEAFLKLIKDWTK